MTLLFAFRSVRTSAPLRACKPASISENAPRRFAVPVSKTGNCVYHWPATQPQKLLLRRLSYKKCRQYPGRNTAYRNWPTPRPRLYTQMHPARLVALINQRTAQNATVNAHEIQKTETAKKLNLKNHAQHEITRVAMTPKVRVEKTLFNIDFSTQSMGLIYLI
jgi:hypothetical protein